MWLFFLTPVLLFVPRVCRCQCSIREDLLRCCSLLCLITSMKHSLIISFQELVALFVFITHLTYLIAIFFFLCRIYILPFQSDKSPLEDHFLLVFKFLTVLLYFQLLTLLPAPVFGPASYVQCVPTKYFLNEWVVDIRNISLDWLIEVEF